MSMRCADHFCAKLESMSEDRKRATLLFNMERWPWAVWPEGWLMPLCEGIPVHFFQLVCLFVCLSLCVPVCNAGYGLCWHVLYIVNTPLDLKVAKELKSLLSHLIRASSTSSRSRGVLVAVVTFLCLGYVQGHTR